MNTWVQSAVSSVLFAAAAKPKAWRDEHRTDVERLIDAIYELFRSPA